MLHTDTNATVYGIEECQDERIDYTKMGVFACEWLWL